ncbi:MAG TPA: type II toxin-antitoxin system HicA family toxin [Rhodanobacter sp.]|nr:type II toxin-antitoxin system HicA family toxin [Rhodanobacter sp.]
MNSKQRGTLAAVFATPTHKDVEWPVVESPFKAAGCAVVEGDGSRVRFVFAQHVATSHRPHPATEAKAYQVEQAREFLMLIGATP